MSDLWQQLPRTDMGIKPEFTILGTVRNFWIWYSRPHCYDCGKPLTTAVDHYFCSARCANHAAEMQGFSF
jgi:hypothetical protein